MEVSLRCGTQGAQQRWLMARADNLRRIRFIAVLECGMQISILVVSHVNQTVNVNMLVETILLYQ